MHRHCYLLLLLIIGHLPSSSIAQIPNVPQSEKTEGVIISYKAPLFSEPKKSSKVLQWVRKGQIVYIHQQHFNTSTDNFTAFLSTLDKGGNVAYIPREYVRLIFRDQREVFEKYYLQGNDPTDHTPVGALDPDFPLVTIQKFRSTFALGTFFAPDHTYPRSQSYQETSTGLPWEISFLHVRNANFDTQDVFYFGAALNVSGQKRSYQLFNGAKFTASDHIWELGPVILHDTYKSSHQRWSIWGGIFLSYERFQLTQTDELTSAESSFSSWSPFVKLGVLWQQLRVLNKLNLICNINLDLVPSHSFSPVDKDLNNSLTQETYKLGLESQLSLLLGTQVDF